MILGRHGPIEAEGPAQRLLDFVRAMDLAFFAVLLGMTVWIVRNYYRAYRLNPGRRGLLPKHVWLIAISHLLLAGEAAVQNLTRLGHNFTAYVPYNFFAFSLSVYALWQILGHQNRGVQTSRTVAVVEEYDVAAGPDERE